MSRAAQDPDPVSVLHIDVFTRIDRIGFDRDPVGRRAGVEYRPPYCLRHTAISHWLAAGVPIFDVSMFAGTSLQIIQRVYGHLVAGSTESARARMDTFNAEQREDGEHAQSR